MSRGALYYEPVKSLESSVQRYYKKPEDEIILKEINEVIAVRATYDYRRVTTMINRKRTQEGRHKVNRKRVQRVMKIRCHNGEKVFVAFALDCCDREAFSFVARKEPLSADDIEELMVRAVEVRFGEKLKCPREVQWLSDRGSIYRARSVKNLAAQLNLKCCYTRAYSPEPNGMAESFVKTFKRDYVYQADCDSAETVLRLLPEWFADYNNVAPHSALGMQSPIEYRKSINL